jgi:HK97 family phage prohead protease
MTVEYRAWMPDDSEIRAEGDGMSFTGYAIRYNAKSEPLPFRETIAPGAVTRSLRSRNEIKAFINHDTNLVIGSTRSGTLRLVEDERGVRTDIDLPDTTYGRDLSVSVQRGDASGMSFGFSVVKDKWSDDCSERTITELRLHEVSVVTGFPAYRQTTAAVRALPLLAKRTGVDIDALAEAFDALSAGTLDNDQAALLTEAVDRARPEAPEPEPVDLSALHALSDLLKKRDDI